MKEIKLKCSLTDQEVSAFEQVHPDHNNYDLLIEEPTRVYKPNGDLLLALNSGAITEGSAKQAYNILRKLNSPATNRGSASGAKAGSDVAYQVKTKAGYKTNTTRLTYKDSVGKGSSSIIGYFDRYVRFPYCRECSFNQQSPTDWASLQPFIQQVDRCFAATLPDRYFVQRAMADATEPAYRINNTAFTTITVNKNWQTACHKDSGDLREGFGVMAYLQAGKLDGGYLVLPKFKVAVKLRSLDVVMFDTHELHGNTAISGRKNAYERITSVFYFRENMIRCGNANYELDRAKYCRQKGKVYDAEEIQRGDRLKAEILTKYKNATSLPHPSSQQSQSGNQQIITSVN